MDSDDSTSNEWSSEEPSGPGDESTPNRRIALVGGGAIVLEPAGFRILDSRSRKRAPLHKYESMTHVVAADRMLLIGLQSGLQTIRNADFRDSEQGPEQVRRALLGRLAARPDGEHWIEEMNRVDRLGRRSARCVATWGTVVLCLLGTWLQLRDPIVELVGSFVPDLFARGEYWRAVTAHFLHGLSEAPTALTALFGDVPGLPFHLAINVGGLIVLGHLVERPLGSWRTALIVALSGIGAMLGIVLSRHVDVIGASGLVSGLAGAIAALELKYPASLPSPWRLPRRLFLGAVIVQFLVIDQLLWRYVAGGAHLGGFVGGFAAAWWLGPPSIEGLTPSSRIRLYTCFALAVVALCIAGALPLARHDMDALERHASRLLYTPPSVPLFEHENATAWFIATGEEPTPTGLELAIALADRAVTSTEHMHPGFLDTLAEALFQGGYRLDALLAIDEAIRLMPNETYFVEQRRRFTGERNPEDRPPPPGTNFDSEPRLEEDLERLPIDPQAPILTI